MFQNSTAMIYSNSYSLCLWKNQFIESVSVTIFKVWSTLYKRIATSATWNEPIMKIYSKIYLMILV
jgi:hypothetical protein